MRQSAEHNHEFSLCNKFYLKKIDPAVFQLKRCKRRTRQTETIKTTEMSSASRRLFRESDPSAEGGQKIIIERIVVEIRLIQKPFGMIDKIE
jgi:hypothetical protein